MALGDFAKKCVAEFIGTFMLVFTVGCNLLSGNKIWGGVSVASVLMVMVYALGGISANFNPAVTFCLGLCGVHHEVKTIAVFMLVQLVAALSATFCYSFLYWETSDVQPFDGFDFIGAGLCEIFYTFMLCFVVLNVAPTKHHPNGNDFYGLAIGFVMVAGAYGAGVVSGGCFNPAVAVAIDLGSPKFGFGWCFAYVAFEFVGAALAAGLWQLVRPEEFSAEKTRVTELVSEFVGTFLLVLTVGLNVLGKSPAAAYSIAACLTCMVYSLADVSGAHFNPAVTAAVYLTSRDRKSMSMEKAASYVGVQLLAGLLAALTYTMVYGGTTFDLGPIGGASWSQVAVAEVVFTFVLCYVVLSVTISATTQTITMCGLAIGACVVVGGVSIGRISGGSLNPAVSFGVAISHMENMHKALLYSLFELLGAGLAAGVIVVTPSVDMHK